MLLVVQSEREAIKNKKVHYIYCTVDWNKTGHILLALVDLTAEREVGRYVNRQTIGRIQNFFQNVLKVKVAVKWLAHAIKHH